MKKEYALQKSGFLPDLSIGYINQQIEGVGGLDALQFGVGIPLFFWAQQGKMQAAKLGNKKAEAEYENQMLAISTEFKTKQQELQKFQLQLNWYDERGLKSASELIRFADRAYNAGEIDYVEYINSLEQAIKIKRDHLDVLKQYNQCALDLQYLSGSFQ